LQWEFSGWDRGAAATISDYPKTENTDGMWLLRRREIN
jgi:hypothetical protein